MFGAASGLYVCFVGALSVCHISAVAMEREVVAERVAECPRDKYVDFLHSLPDGYEMLAHSGECLLGKMTNDDLVFWVHDFAPKIGFVNTLKQLVTACMNFPFYIRTGEAFAQKSFIDLIASLFPSESRILVPVECLDEKKELRMRGRRRYKPSKTCTILSLFQTAFSLNNEVRHCEQNQLGFSFFDNDETARKFQEAFENLPSTWTITNHSTDSYPSISLKVHQDICRYCRDKLKELQKNYLSHFPKLDHIEGVIYRYMEKRSTLSKSDPLLVSLCPVYYGRGHMAWSTSSITPSGKSFLLISKTLRFRRLHQKHLFEIAALSGLLKVFKHLVINNKQCFIENLDEISVYAVEGGNFEIIHLCEQEGSKPFNHSDHNFWKFRPFSSCFRSAYSGSKINVLHWLFRNCSDFALTCRNAVYFFIDDFHNSPVTTSKTLFLLSSMDEYCSNEVDRHFLMGDFRNAVEKNVFPIVMFLLKPRMVSLNDDFFEKKTLFSWACMGNPYDGDFFSVEYAKLMIENGGNPNDKFRRLLDQSETDLFELACANKDWGFANYLVRHGFVLP
jgi:hypothetical protein